MSNKPYDDTFKELVDLDPQAWASWAMGRPVAGATAIDSDLSTVTGLADKVIRQPRDGGDLLIDIEAESSHAGTASEDALLYSVLLTRRHRLPVRTILLLLRPEANATAASGVLERRETVAAPEPYLRFTYQVHRVWLDPLAPLLAGPLALLPLAVLTNEAQAEIETVGEQAGRRIVAETPPADRGKMVSALALLLGMRHELPLIERIIQRVTTMEDNGFVRGLLQRGAERGEAQGELRRARETIIRLGQIKCGPIRPEARAAIEAIEDIPRLTDPTERILYVDTWDALLAEPGRDETE